jgi:ammonium transporter, Amt family
MPVDLAPTYGLAFLIPIGYALIAAGGLSAHHARHAAVSFFAAAGLAVLGYVACGFALQFGGIGLTYERPGFEGLIWEWSAFGPTWGPGWGMAGLAGWGLSGPAATPAARALALANLPMLITAVTLPVVALRSRVPAWAAGLAGLLTGALIYPVAGNWVWGGGWLANLGLNLVDLGHGFVDLAGAGLVSLLAASVTLAGFVVFLPRGPRPVDLTEPVALPRAYHPLLCLLGAGLLLAGATAWVTLNPLLDPVKLDTERVLLNLILAASASGLLPIAYTWLVAGRPDPLMAARAFAAGVAASLGCALFLSPMLAVALGAAIGLLMPFAIFIVERVLRWNDATGTLAVHGIGGGFGLLAVGLLADGTAGAGWNGIGVGEYLDVAGQGVTGLLAAPGFQPDWPGQMQAQLLGGAAIIALAFFATWLALAPPATVLNLFTLRPRRTAPAALPADTEPPLPEPAPVLAEVEPEPAAIPMATNAETMGS